MNEKYTVDYFIDKFTAIPDDKWTVGRLHRKGQSCALGHCGVEYTDGNDVLEECKVIYGYKFSAEGWALQNLFENNLNLKVPPINDISGKNLGFPQEHPKQRILAALQKIKEKLSISEKKIEVEEQEEYEEEKLVEQQTI